MKNTALCIASSEPEAQQITNTLRDNGFANDDISVLFPDRSGTRDFAHEQNTKTPEGAIAGVGTGGALGAVAGWAIGIGALAIPGVGPFIAAGPIVALLAGAAVGATVGGITGALIGMGIPEIEAKQYEEKIQGGNILISVHVENDAEIDTAKRIFREADAQDISVTSEKSIPNQDDRKNDKRYSTTATNLAPAAGVESTATPKTLRDGGQFRS